MSTGTVAAATGEGITVLAPVTLVTPIEPDPGRPQRFRAVTRLAVEATEPVFAGHYPGRPIFPGVCLLDCALRSARLAHPAAVTDSRPTEIESARFTGIVVPGDIVTTELTWQPRDEGRRCSARLSTGNGEVATIRLRYGPGWRPEQHETASDDTVLDAADIRRLLPHRYPILLVDRVTELAAGARLTATKAVTGNEFCYAADTAGTAYPVSLLLESWVQAAALLAVGTPGTGGADALLLLGSVTGAGIGRPVLPGEIVTHRVALTRSLGDTLLFEGGSSVDAEPVQAVRQAVLAFRTDEPRRTHA
ncbi:3-hydroxyacyl-[acyl-carrier-protein] dehydratase [Amycolatopsis sulphurea]|uniref:3-hydroxyacyl-[acyl-carrier-protein] dehydratase n=1 Tax=Amycolatopsis sulphurea TaxID=76022 RepID=A0A2A9FH64_9PSEU|nr:hypothetical protein [Amycolatopsis sulphurea]PFG49912.1 3-hydroxyacyl-[acyl-carrier-protein] dehydratase [Amycolatopsis sulphurea]